MLLMYENKMLFTQNKYSVPTIPGNYFVILFFFVLSMYLTILYKQMYLLNNSSGWVWSQNRFTKNYPHRKSLISIF